MRYSLPPRRPGQRVRDHAFLLVLQGTQPGALFPLQTRASLIGRDASADVRLGDESVSGHHALVSTDGQGVYIEDLGSRNGTFLNGLCVKGRMPLADGDHLRVGSAVLKFSMTDELEERALVSLVELAMRDPLTGAFNRRHLEDLLKSELAFAVRQNTPLSLVLVDIDRFKRVNDTYGHRAGDVVLQLVAATIQRVLRPYDVFCRYGGEEFLIVARNTTPRNAHILAERIRRRVGSLPLEVGGHRFEVTVSAGVVTIAPDCAEPELEGLFDAVDSALYSAKRGGRNRVVVGRPPAGALIRETRFRTLPPCSNAKPTFAKTEEPQVVRNGARRPAATTRRWEGLP